MIEQLLIKNYCHPIKFGGIKRINPSTNKITINGKTHFAHFSYFTFAIDSAPIVTAEVGIIIFVYSPN